MFLRSLRSALKARHKRALFRLMMDAKSYIRLHFLDAAVRSGLAAALAGPATREELEAKLGVERPELLDALLDVGLALGELSLADGRYRARGRILRAMQTQDGDGLAALAEGFATYYNSVYRHLPERMAGADKGGYLDWIGPVVARFAKLADPYVQDLLREEAGGREALRVLDVGCGSGIYLRTCADVNPRAEGTGLELDPDVAGQARGNLQAWGLAGRFRIMEGNLMDAGLDVGSGYDLIVFSNIVYYFAPEARTDVFARLAALLAPGGCLAVVCNFQGQGKDVFAGNLNVATSSMLGCWPIPDLAETRAQLAGAGLGDQKVDRLMPGSTFYAIRARIG